MSNQKMPFDLFGMPITVYREDPYKTGIAEWHELGGARNNSSEWFLWERHGWWDNEKKQAHFGVPILSEPHKTEKAMTEAIATRIAALEADGWIHKFTTIFDGMTLRLTSVRIP